ncbi:hypothetical protein Q7P35_000362 [Cladosporium inversicolor]
MVRGKRTSKLRDAMSAAPEPENNTAEGEVGTPDEHEQTLDASTSERRYWRDPLTGVQREIWRPGDGDGDVEHDHHDRRGPLVPLEKRWRLYQSSPEGPFKARIIEPPSNVILDDRAAYEILQSNIPRAQLTKRWSHDFNGQANVRHRRTHRGRPAYKDEQATSENDKYLSFKPTAKAAAPYFFSGENNYNPVIYHDLPAAPAETPEPDNEDDTPVKPKRHNQYTAPYLLVRNGAESASLTKGKYRPRVNTFLRRSPSPPWVKDRKRLFGGVGIGRAGNAAPSSTFDFSFAPAPALTGAPTGAESMWVEQDEDIDVKYADEDEEEVLPSVFDNPSSAGGPVATLGNEGATQLHGTPGNAIKRQAPPGLINPRRKVPRQMGYIERLAAGLLREEVEEEAAALSPPVATAARTVRSMEVRALQLEDDLDAANAALNEKESEIAELKLQVEELQTQVALRESVDDN